jgi:hypothetical protein
MGGRSTGVLFRASSGCGQQFSGQVMAMKQWWRRRLMATTLKLWKMRKKRRGAVRGSRGLVLL